MTLPRHPYQGGTRTLLVALALLAMPGCGASLTDTCAAYRWGVLQGVAEQAGTVSPDVSNACLVCPEKVRSGETSPADAARMGALGTCPASEGDDERCLAIAEAAADGVGEAQVAGATCPDVNDADADGLAADADCNDTDDAMPGQDADCDGVRADVDCDDADATQPNDDEDCDGTSSADDCDDTDPTMPGDDADCDGTSAEMDCDDGDSTMPAEDADCDGVATSADCDDTDAAMPADDADCDGVDSAEDCDDGDPGAPSSNDQDCDGVSVTEDCDDLDDAVGGPVPLFPDADADGYGAAGATEEGCEARPGYAAASGDCDDSVAATNPGAAEVCNNFVDDDCDGGPGACVLSGGTTADADASFTGESREDYAGWSVSAAGDVDDDGYGDFLVGAPQATPGVSFDAGVTYLVRGSAAPSDSALATTIAYSGTYPETSGASVSSAGDVNGDGLGDILIGAPYGGENQNGAAYLILGSIAPASRALTAADATLTGESWYDYAGSSVTGVGDMNGDGLDDVAVGAYGASYGAFSSNGAAYVVFGDAAPQSRSLSAADLVFYGGADNARAANVVASAGDVDGDGLSDLLVGANYDDDAGMNSGAAYLLLGDTAGASLSLTDADAKYTGEAASDFAGEALGTAGDVDGDGYADVLVGSPGNADAGRGSGAAYLVLGSGRPADVALAYADAQYTGDANQAGTSVASAGDVNADGLDDILVGAPGGIEGTAYVVFGVRSPSGMSLTAADAIYAGGADDYEVGYSVSGAGDVDGDDYADIVVGAPHSAGYEGAAYLSLGTGL